MAKWQKGKMAKWQVGKKIDDCPWIEKSKIVNRNSQFKEGRIEMFSGTTILAVRRGSEVAIGGDGQVTLQDGKTIVKNRAKKIRKAYKDKILLGFAGAAADAMLLFEELEGKLERYSGDLRRASVELAKDWRHEKRFSKVEAMLAVADAEESFLISGSGDVIVPDDGVLAIGSGSSIALSAARAMLKHTELTASEIVKEAMKITAEICIYTNSNITVETLNCSAD